VKVATLERQAREIVEDFANGNRSDALRKLARGRKCEAAARALLVALHYVDHAEHRAYAAKTIAEVASVAVREATGEAVAL